MSWFLDRLLLDGERLDARVEDNVVAGEHLRTMQGASTVDLTIHDSDRVLIRSGIFNRVPKRRPKDQSRGPFPGASQLRQGVTTLILDGDPYRLAGYSKSGSDLELRFEHEIAALMRQHTRPRVVSRGTYTRAQFIRYVLVGSVKDRRIATYIPSLGKRQPQKKPDIPKREVKREQRILLGGQPATQEQKRNIGLVMQAIENENAPEAAALALIEACIVEAPNFANPIGGEGTSSGILQLTGAKSGPPSVNGSTSTHGGRRDIVLVCTAFLRSGFAASNPDGAIDLARKNPGWTPGQIAAEVQAPRADLRGRYEEHRADAEAVLDAGGGSGGTTYVTEDFLYSVGDLDWDLTMGPRENYWDAAVRLAEEVNWAFYIDENRLVYADDRDLFKTAPVAVVAEAPGPFMYRAGAQHVGAIDFETHYNRRVEEVRFSARADQFTWMPGATIEVADPNMGAAQGKYLIEEIRDRIGSFDVEFVCRRPSPQRAEPAPSVLAVPLPDQSTNPVGIKGGLVYPLPVHGTIGGGPGQGTHSRTEGGDLWYDDNAVDIYVPRGTPVLAVEDGTITKVTGSWSGGASRYDGFRVYLQTATNTWAFFHLTRTPVKPGDSVRAGQQIGVSGAANSSDHLHIACQRGNPVTLLQVGKPFPSRQQQSRSRNRNASGPSGTQTGGPGTIRGTGG